MTHLITDYFAVPIPDDASKVSISKFLKALVFVFDWHPNGGKAGQIKLPSGQWELIGLSDEITESEARGIVEKNGEGYEHYMTDEEYESSDHVYALSIAIESFKSLLKSKSLNERYAILKKVK